VRILIHRLQPIQERLQLEDFMQDYAEGAAAAGPHTGGPAQAGDRLLAAEGFQRRHGTFAKVRAFDGAETPRQVAADLEENLGIVAAQIL
jgi:hypothetical protein